MSQEMGVRLRIANPANLDAFFAELRKVRLDCKGRIAEQPSPSNQSATSFTTTIPQNNLTVFRDNWIQLANDLEYSGILKDPTELKDYVYENLYKRLGCKQTILERVLLHLEASMLQERK